LQIEPLCSTSFPTDGDNKDNDCDGEVDDDICVRKYGLYHTGIYNKKIKKYTDKTIVNMICNVLW